ncbi:hypothetical protein NEOLEDRAFT_1174648 [Neolentinus lepideus HHB14362 ss-1]|uniref:Uncharacterized protein n=1 Tax=Neolentinus lepideus HHB14362 ss-1 TaxID=1314782 RepID=A0A165VFQ2_9AGAM|nr:hypothetical protein NEOLEDRAFT_1174648 [Neolentinus lepideus HHB14362 ss-1]
MPFEEIAGHVGRDFADYSRTTLSVPTLRLFMVLIGDTGLTAFRLTVVIDNTASRVTACVLINYTITLGLCRSVQNILNKVEVESVVAVVGSVTFYYIPSIGTIALTCVMILESTKSVVLASVSIVMGLALPLFAIAFPRIMFWAKRVRAPRARE